MSNDDDKKNISQICDPGGSKDDDRNFDLMQELHESIGPSKQQIYHKEGEFDRSNMIDLDRKDHDFPCENSSLPEMQNFSSQFTFDNRDCFKDNIGNSEYGNNGYYSKNGDDFDVSYSNFYPKETGLHLETENNFEEEAFSDQKHEKRNIYGDEKAFYGMTNLEESKDNGCQNSNDHYKSEYNKKLFDAFTNSEIKNSNSPKIADSQTSNTQNKMFDQYQNHQNHLAKTADSLIDESYNSQNSGFTRMFMHDEERFTEFSSASPVKMQMNNINNENFDPNIDKNLLEYKFPRKVLAPTENINGQSVHENYQKMLDKQYYQEENNDSISSLNSGQPYVDKRFSFKVAQQQNDPQIADDQKFNYSYREPFAQRQDHSNRELLYDPPKQFFNGYAYDSMNDQPLYVNVKQYNCIRKRKARRDLLDGYMKKNSKNGYLHESRHRHAMNRRRAPSGRFLTKAETEELLRKEKQSGSDCPL
ncbi:hypothetical protein EDEG_01335 [Edhazardia aedis USNM 41457]|uniref:Transcriptional activator HAP2 n=1 Tax=Edhazardia aedis (strain USNM 41457) TaxID=1003232 RepID=J9DPI5_EDHAE|nr:hypothetical protein EDEG_01335 [Edhazardia aedis USNM 41457]|eukprot:EJW04465.1 hypothetical protein EDEG_01335 [Edhazardia aedis USNM 41457]